MKISQPSGMHASHRASLLDVADAWTPAHEDADFELPHASQTDTPGLRNQPRASLTAVIRQRIAQSLLHGACTFELIAEELGMHQRTLQRRLREEGSSFEVIKDDVRRDAARQYLQQTNVPLMKLAELLGYSETSVLSRSCHRWFDASPREVRRRALRAFRR